MVVINNYILESTNFLKQIKGIGEIKNIFSVTTSDGPFRKIYLL